jgi:hypothetical protein
VRTARRLRFGPAETAMALFVTRIQLDPLDVEAIHWVPSVALPPMQPEPPGRVSAGQRPLLSTHPYSLSQGNR